MRWWVQHQHQHQHLLPHLLWLLLMLLIMIATTSSHKSSTLSQSDANYNSAAAAFSLIFRSTSRSTSTPTEMENEYWGCCREQEQGQSQMSLGKSRFNSCYTLDAITNYQKGRVESPFRMPDQLPLHQICDVESDWVTLMMSCSFVTTALILWRTAGSNLFESTISNNSKTSKIFRQAPPRFLLLLTLVLAISNLAELVSGQESTFTIQRQMIVSSNQCPNPRSVFVDPSTGVTYAACSDAGIISISSDSSTVTVIASASACPTPHSVIVNPVNGIIHAACLNGGIISVNGTRVTTLATTSQCPNAGSVAVDPASGKVFATCGNQGVIAISSTAAVTTLVTSAQCSNADDFPGGVTLNFKNGIIYASCFFGGIVSINGTNVTTIATLSQCSNPTTVTVDPKSGTVYGACSGTGGIVSISGTTVTQIASSSQCQLPNGVFVSSWNGVVYAACGSSGIISISGSSVTTLASSSVCVTPYAVTVNRITGAAFGACSGNSGGVVSIRTATLTALVSSYLYSQSVSVDPGSGVVYAASFSSNSVISIDGTSVTVLATYTQCPNAQHLAFIPTTQLLYVACQARGIISINGTTITLLANATQCVNPSHVSVDPNTAIVYASCYRSGIISIRGTTVTTIATAAECPNPQGVVVNPSTGDVFASCSSGGVVSISRDGTVAVIFSSSICPTPSKVTVNPSNGVVYAACFNGGILSIDGTSTTTLATSTQCPSAAGVLLYSGIVYAICGTGIVSISGSTVTTIATTTQCPGSFDMAINPLTNVLYATCTDPDLGVVFISVDQSCHYGFEFASRGCSQCAAGRFRNYSMALSDVPSCSSCPSGLVMPFVGSGGQCVTCPAGTYALSASLPCSNCTIGWYSSQPGATSCLPCPGGYFGSTPGVNSSCSGVCFQGYWCSEGSNSPTQIRCGSRSAFCPAGSSSPVPVSKGMWTTGSVDGSEKTMTRQEPCPPSMYCDGSGIFKPCLPGTYQNQINQSSCISCEPGFISGMGANNCTICPEGHTSLAASSVCSPCSPGTYLNTTSALCTQCGIGRFSASPAASMCDECPPGQIANTIGSNYCQLCPSGRSNHTDAVTGASTCEDCPAGFVSTEGSACKPCMIGFFSAQPASISCVPCSPGAYSNMTGSQVCQNCTKGSFSNTGAATKCSPCPQGSFASSGAAFCTSCSPGYAPNALSSICEPCPMGTASADGERCYPCVAGQVAAAEGSSYCRQCDPGSTPVMDPTIGTLVCSNCPAGTSSQGGAPCSSCVPGMFAATNGSFACTVCAQGTASNRSGLATSCPACPPGTYQGSSGQEECLSCPVQHFSPSEGAISCQYCSSQVTPNRTLCVADACPLNHYYSPDDGQCPPCPLGTAGTGGCQLCPSGFYTPESGTPCTSCYSVKGLTCANGLASVDPGYWAYRLPADASGLQLFATVECPSDYCPGGPLQITGGDTTNTTNGSSSLGITYCNSPRLNSPDNLFCAYCEPGYIPWNDKCVSCSGSNGGLWTAGIILSFLLVVFLLQSSGSAAGSLSILLFFIQTGALEVGPIAKWLNWLQVFNFDTKSTSSCLAEWSPPQQTLFSLFMPIILLAELAVIAVLHYCLYKSSINGREANSASYDSSNSASAFSFIGKLRQVIRGFSVDTYIAGSMSILLFCYTQVSTACFSFLYCVDVIGDSRLFAAPTVDCHSSTYNVYLVPVIIAIITYVVAFPVSIFVLLYSNKESLFIKIEDARRISSSGAQSSVNVFLVRYAPLFTMYQPHAFFWQPLVLLRRAAFVVVSVVLVQQTAVRFLAYTLLHFFSVLLHGAVHPFGSSRLNKLETASYSLLLVMSAILTGYQPPFSDGLQATIVLLIGPAAVFMFGYVVYERFTERVLNRKKSVTAGQLQEHDLARPRATVSAEQVEVELPRLEHTIAHGLVVSHPSNGTSSSDAAIMNSSYVRSESETL